MGDQNKNTPDPNQSMQMNEYGGVSMAPSSNVQGQMTMTMTQAQACISGLPALAPAPQHSHPMQASQLQQLHQGQHQQHPSNQQGMAGQPMTLQQSLNQPQFQLIQQHFPGQQYATFPQFAYTNQQGQIVLQPAQFSLHGGPGQPQGQQVILTGMSQKPGQQQLISSSPGNQGKPGQPSYTITSSGQLQMPGQGPQQQQTFMIANPMGPGLQGPVSMSGPNGPAQAIQTSMAGVKGNDGKPVQCPTQLTGQPNQQQPQFVIPSPGMTYMQAGHHQLIPNGQLIFRAPGPSEQQVMFSPSSQPHPQPQPQVQHQNTMPNPNNTMGGMQLPTTHGVRPTMPVGPPPGKTAISRAIAPLLPNVSQTNARIGYAGGNMQGQQPSPKSKQKMSPRATNNGMGRPPVPKGGAMKMGPRMSGGAAGSPMPGSPGPPQMMPGSPRPQMHVQHQQQQQHQHQHQQQQHQQLQLQQQGGNQGMNTPAGPPTLSPMMGGEPTTAPLINVPATTVLTSQISKFNNTSIPVTSASPNNHTETALDPPTLTKEIMTPMPNLGQPNFGNKGLSNLGHKPGNNFLSPDNEHGLANTPKAVVKPQVLTHVIDGHVIKESSQPFPVSPVKATARRKSEKTDEKSYPVSQGGGLKRGPGRPPGSTKSNEPVKSAGGEPPEKKLKGRDNEQEPPGQGTYPAPAPPPQQQQQLPQQQQQPLTSVRGNPLKWNVAEVCDFIKNLPGCGEYVDDFAQQEIDGQALMLLKADHLMTAMSIKLGPALKICSHIEHIREELNRN